MSKTTPTKDSIRAEFEELVEKDSFWSKFVGSQFVSMLTLFITQIVYRCFQYADAALAEGFISTATRRSSILAAAETNSYVGTKPTPSSGMIEITATSEDAPAVIPKNMPLISDDQYPYMTMDVCRLVDGTGTVEVAQLEIQEVTYTVTAAKEFLEVVLSKALTAVCYKLEVFVTTDGKTTQWSSSTMFRLAGSLGVSYRFGQGEAAPVVAPAPAPAPEVQTKHFTLKSDVLFNFNKATLKPEGQAALDQLYSQLSNLDPKDGSVVVLGYTDRIGSDAYNQGLSERRAQSVVDYLISKGIPADKISARGMGESNPVTGNTCDNVKQRAALIDCLAPDRRVEIEVKGIKDVVTQPQA